MRKSQNIFGIAIMVMTIISVAGFTSCATQLPTSTKDTVESYAKANDVAALNPMALASAYVARNFYWPGEEAAMKAADQAGDAAGGGLLGSLVSSVSKVAVSDAAYGKYEDQLEALLNGAVQKVADALKAQGVTLMLGNETAKTAAKDLKKMQKEQGNYPFTVADGFEHAYDSPDANTVDVVANNVLFADEINKYKAYAKFVSDMKAAGAVFMGIKTEVVSGNPMVSMSVFLMKNDASFVARTWYEATAVESIPEIAGVYDPDKLMAVFTDLFNTVTADFTADISKQPRAPGSTTRGNYTVERK
jgi:hypothetical protein